VIIGSPAEPAFLVVVVLVVVVLVAFEVNCKVEIIVVLL